MAGVKSIGLFVLAMIYLVLLAGRAEAEHEAAKSSLSNVLTALQGTLKLLEGVTPFINNVNISAALTDCFVNLESAVDHVNASLNAYSGPYVEKSDVLTWLSAAMTDQDTCLDGLEGINHLLLEKIKSSGMFNMQLLSQGLEGAANLSSSAPPPTRRLLSAEHDDSPTWLSATHRGLMARELAAITPNVVVSKNGRIKTIQAAVNQAPKNSKTPYIIKINAGVYAEQVTVPKSATNLVFVGDGAGKTIITGSRNVQQSGVTTFNSATLIITGANFLGRDFTVRNTAGAAKHQAVAVRVSADKVTFYLAGFEGFQDTLYTHTLRQFYRQCTILGSVDFIFGNGAVVLQSSTIMAREGNPGQQVTFTAQGRTDKNQNTGLSFHRCTITGTAGLKANIAQHPTYLGRPWKLYSRTVYMLGYMDSIINPAGWLPWAGDFALKTLFYGEYANTGPGANRAKRVSWSTGMTLTQARPFAVRPFIIQGGDAWIPSQVPYNPAL